MTSLIREISILKDMDHPCVMNLKDVIPVYTDGSVKNNMGLDELYIILEYVHSDLRKLSKCDVYLSDEQVRSIMYQIL